MDLLGEWDENIRTFHYIYFHLIILNICFLYYKKIKEIFSRIRFVYRRTGNFTKLVVTVAILLCICTLIALRLSTTSMQERMEDLRQQAGMLENANEELNEKIDELGSVKSVVEIAEEELGLVQTGAVVIETEPDAEP